MAKKIVKISEQELEKLYRERTLVLCKPDAVRLGLHGEILSRISRLFYKTVLVRMFNFTEASVQDFYGPVIDMWEPRDEIIKIFMKMTNAPTIAIVVEGPNARLAMRKMAGGLPSYELIDGEIKFKSFKAQFEPLNAPMGTMRGDYSALDIPLPDTELIPVPNYIHATETAEDYDREISILVKHNHITPDDFYPYSKAEWDVIFGSGRGSLK
jgi:nucleoside diphosphate kinase